VSLNCASVEEKFGTNYLGKSARYFLGEDETIFTKTRRSCENAGVLDLDMRDDEI
jgi:hypothetical protein